MMECAIAILVLRVVTVPLRCAPMVAQDMVFAPLTTSPAHATLDGLDMTVP